MSFEMLPYYLFNSETCAGMKKIINQTDSKIKPRASPRCLGQSVAASGIVDYEFLFLLFQIAASTGLRFRVRMFRMHGPQWNNTRIILTDARYPAIDAFYLVGTGGN